MAEWKKIVCAVDFSEPSRLAMVEAVDLARRHEAELTLVHVFDAAKVAAAELGMAPLDLFTKATPELEGKLAAWRQDAETALGRPASAALLIGDPAAELLRFAAERFAELVVVGTSGRGGVSRLVLGSVADRVVRQAHCPVLVVRPTVTARPD
jgi:universal stress protein A